MDSAKSLQIGRSNKVRILAAVKSTWKERVTTIFVRQGHYARDAAAIAQYPAPDLILEHIGDLKNLPIPDIKAAAIKTPRSVS